MQKTNSIAKKLLAVVWLAAIVSVGAQTFETTSCTYYKGGDSSNFTVDVKATTDVAIGTYYLQVAFDSSVLNFVSGDWKLVGEQDFEGASKSIKAKNGVVTLGYSYDTKVNGIPAGTKDGVVATLTFSHVLDGSVPAAEALPTGKAFDFAVSAILEWEATDGSPIDPSAVSAVNGAFNVVKAFNAADVAETANDWDGSAVIVPADKFTFTDDKGEAVSGNLTSIGTVTCSIDSIDPGKFTVVNGGIKWSPAPNTKVAIGHKQAVFTVPFSATGDKGGDDATLTLTVNPANALPVLDSFNVTKNTEGDKFVIEFTASDADGDAITFSNGGYFLVGGSKAGAFDGNVWTSNDNIGFSEVGHPDKSMTVVFNCTMSDDIATVPVSVEVTINDKDQLPTTADFTSASVAIKPAAPKVTDTLEYTLSGAPQKDADGDAFTYNYTWSKNAPYAKGDVVTLDVTATTNPYGDGATEAVKVTSASVTFVNSVPVITSASPAQIFIQKGVATSADATINATDADNDTLTFSVVSNDTTKGTASFNGKVLTYTVADPSAKEVTDVVTIKANDGEADSATFDVAVLYCENPVPEITSVVYSTDTIPEVDEAGAPVTFTATVTAIDKPAGSIPAAVGALTVETAVGLNATVIETTGDATSKTYVVEFTTNGYTTVEHPAATKSIAILFSVLDDESLSSGTKEDSVTVVDVDQLPTAPTAVNRTPEEAFHGDTLVALAAGAMDYDEDAVSYSYSWSVSTDGGENFVDINKTGDTLNDSSIIVKGNVIKATAVASTEPYGDGNIVFSENSCDGIWTIGNTAPWFKELADQSTDEATKAALEYTWTIAENSEVATINVVAVDVDAEDGVDNLSYEVSELDEEIGTVEIDEDGVITFTPAADYNNKDEVEKPSFTVTVTDESAEGAVNTATVYLNVTEVNAQPEVTAKNQYLLPSQIGTDVDVTFEAFMGENEEDQELAAAEIVTWDASFFAAEPAIAFDGQDVTITFNALEEADLMKGGAITFKVQDNGTTAGAEDPKWSEEVTFMVYGGASPWYPVISFECADPENHADGHTFHLEADGESYDITVKGGRTQLLPFDYQLYGVEGFKDNTDIAVTVYVWTNNEGTTDEICAESEMNVVEYGLPGEAETTTPEVEADANGYATLEDISVPLAKNYTVVIEDENGNVVTEIGPNEFESDDDGMIVSVIEELTVQLPKAGEYTVNVKGENPNGEGEETEVATITVPNDSDKVLKWIEPEIYCPDSCVLTSGTVGIMWPLATNAESYTLEIFGADGSLAKKITGLTGNSTTVTLPINASPINYTWRVFAFSGKKSIVSETCNFTLATTSKDVIATDVWVNPEDEGSIVINLEALLNEDVKVSIDYQYFSVAKMKWFNGKNNAELTEDLDALVLPINGAEVAEDDYVALLIYQNGKQVGDWVVYQVQDEEEAIIVR